MFGGGGFTFGSSTTTAQASANTTKPGGGFSFSGTGGGFNFGTQATGASTAASTAPTTSLFSTPTATSTGGFSFGANTAKPAAVTTTASGGFNFAVSGVQPVSSTATSGFSFAGQTLAGQQKTGGFALGAPTTSTAAPTLGGVGFKLGSSSTAPGIRPMTTPTVTPGGSFTFGTPVATAQRPTLPTTTATPASTAAGGISFGTQQPTATTSGAVKHTLGGAIAPTQATFALGSAVKTGTTTAAAATTVASTSATGFTLGGASTTTTSASTGLTLGGATATSTSAPSGGLGFSFGATSSTAAATTTTTTGSTLATAGAASKLPQMNYRQLEEAINKWNVELQEQEKIFLQQATQVNAWDRLLILNGEKITQLNSDVERVKLDQQRLDNELDFIRAQQRELEELLTPLESAVQQLPSISYQQHADLEREHTYQLAENIDAQLKRMVQDLKDIIDHVNSTNSNQDNNDPIHQITKILNAHMDSLQWIDQNSSLLNRRVEEISKQMDLQRKEQERNFRLAYD